jgi:tyrosyl-tRNA synthetase
MFTYLSNAEITELVRATAERPAARDGQRTLARDLTSLVHGQEQTQRVEAASQALFGRGDLADLDEATLSAALTEAPNVALSQVRADGAAVSVVDLLAATQLCASKSAARRAIDEGGVCVNNVRVGDAEALVSAADFLHGRWLVLRRGRRSFAGVRTD